jgi:hypothetical protein
MKLWELKSEDPGAFTIAADSRFAKTNYTNDHIWELKLVGGEPPALALQTTFGLRARSFRIFPRFVEGDDSIIDPNQFVKKPAVAKFYPNYLEVIFSPLTGIDVRCEYWVPFSNIVTGRISVTNSRLIQRQLNLQIAAQLLPSPPGQRMVHDTIDSSKVLSGQSGDLYPVVFVKGVLENIPGPYPALSVEMDLAPGGKRQVIWVEAASHSPKASFDLIQENGFLKWETEISRLEVINNSIIEITTGDPDWDAALRLSQKTALGLSVGPSDQMPYPSFVLSRQPDHGYSSLGNGSDFGHIWNGQSPLETYFLCGFLLPGHSNIAKGYFLNFLSTQTSSGFIDFKPGLAGQKSHLMATPILTHIAWMIYQVTEDINFLEQAFPSLLSFIQAWFSKGQDRDADGLPEWERPIHSGFEDHPLYSQWRPWSLGGDISKVESPSLCAFLYNEISLLIKISKVIDQTMPVESLKAISDNLKSAVDESWDSNESIYRNWDRESHFSPPGENLGDLVGAGEIEINRTFGMPVRLTISLELGEDLKRDVRIFIHGTGPQRTQLIERIEADQLRWHIDQGKGIVNSERIYSSIDTVVIEGTLKADSTSIKVMDISGKDHTLLLPLWAGLPEPEQANLLVEKTITSPQYFGKPHGIPACIQDSVGEDHPCWNIHMIWNNLIGGGLIRYGFREEAAELTKKLMETIIQNLKTHKSTFNYYHAITGMGIGDKGALGGLAPLGLFFDTLGIQVISTKKVNLMGYNPFPWPVTIRYRGLTIQREDKVTKITFPGGQSAVVKSQEPRLITLEDAA